LRYRAKQWDARRRWLRLLVGTAVILVAVAGAGTAGFLLRGQYRGEEPRFTEPKPKSSTDGDAAQTPAPTIAYEPEVLQWDPASPAIHGLRAQADAIEHQLTAPGQETPENSWPEVVARLRAGLDQMETQLSTDEPQRPSINNSPLPRAGEGQGVRGSGPTKGGEVAKGISGGTLLAPPASLSLPLADGISLDLVRIPAGQFVMGQEDGCADERPTSIVKIDSSFWMGRCEVTNELFALFDPSHDSRLEHADFLQFSPGERGWTLSRPTQPVVRVSWNEAMAFCRWLSEKTGRRFTLPSEAQWECACRAGTPTPLWYGALDNDFSSFANVSDASHQVIDRFGEYGRADVIPPWRPADARYDDRSRVSAPVGSYRPNPWGLFDMHGNVAEWTRSEYRPYPFQDGSSQGQAGSAGKKVVRGGSWYDRPDRCRSAFRQTYRAYQPVYDVGFRVICEADGDRPGVANWRSQALSGRPGK
jgi:formylglycine-generating enzyme required for sulfatase activity